MGVSEDHARVFELDLAALLSSNTAEKDRQLLEKEKSGH